MDQQQFPAGIDFRSTTKRSYRDLLLMLSEIEKAGAAARAVSTSVATPSFEELMKRLRLPRVSISEQVVEAVASIKANLHLVNLSYAENIAALSAGIVTIGQVNTTLDPATLVGRGTIGPPPAPSPVIDIAVFSEERSLSRIEVISCITADVISRIRNDRHELCKLTPGKFEELIMELLSAMGNEVRQAGKTTTPDGFVDIVFWSKTGVPIIGAVQVKHHDSVQGKTGVDAIQRMEGVMSKHKKHFNLGMVVTNTSFTADAQWMAKDSAIYLRLRDELDIDRWIKGDFSNEEERREFPAQIQLTRHLAIDLKKKMPNQ